MKWPTVRSWHSSPISCKLNIKKWSLLKRSWIVLKEYLQKALAKQENSNTFHHVMNLLNKTELQGAKIDEDTQIDMLLETLLEAFN